MTQKSPNSSPGGSQDALGTRFSPEAVLELHFRFFLDPPRDPENRAPMQAGARFPENQLLALGVEKGPQNDPQNDPKGVPRGSQIAKMDVQNGCSILGEMSSRFSVIFRLPQGSPGTPQNDQKGLKNRPRLREASGEPFWSHLGVIFGAF